MLPEHISAFEDGGTLPRSGRPAPSGSKEGFRPCWLLSRLDQSLVLRFSIVLSRPSPAMIMYWWKWEHAGCAAVISTVEPFGVALH